MTDPSGSRRYLLAASALLIVFALIGIVIWATHRSTLPPQPSASTLTAPVATSYPASTTPVYPPNSIPPASLAIPALGVSHSLISVGLNSDGTLQVPGLDQVDVPAWYHNSPSPGAVGPAVIVGHVDSATAGDGIFFKLGALLPGQDVDVTRVNGDIEHFAVTKIQSTPKASFPTSDVYGNTPDPELRLITCGGQFDPATGHYLNNVIVFARFTGQEISH